MGSSLLFPLRSDHTPGLYKGTKCIGFTLPSHPHYRLSIVRVHTEHKQKDSDFFFPEPVFWNVLRKGPQIMV